MNHLRIKVALVWSAATLMALSSAQPVLSQVEPAKEPKAESAWRTDLAVFDKYLAKLTAEARIPEKEALESRDQMEVLLITDGLGGYVDLMPAKDTVQFRVNEAIQGQAVKWEFELAEDETQCFGDTIALTPAFVLDGYDPGTEKVRSSLNMLLLKPLRKLPTKLQAGDRIKLEGTIGDSSTNKAIMMAPFAGPTAIYHLDFAAHPVFWVGLKNVKIARIDGKN